MITSVQDPNQVLQEIVSRIYLGSCDAFKKDILLEKKITHVLSLGDFENNLDIPLEYKNINVMDIPSQNMIQYFDESIQFIQDTYKAGGRILIHCQAGVSRSATILAACLMKSKNISRDDALAFIRRKRSVTPNTGFMDQLQLYYDLKFDVDAKHVEYRRFLVAIMAEEQANYGYVEHSAFAPDPEYCGLSEISNNHKVFRGLRCRKCRRLLVGSENVIEHEAGKGQVAFSYHKRNTDINITTATTEQNNESEMASARTTMNQQLNPLLAALASKNNVCSSYFIEPMEWLVVDEIQGRIDCPKCQCKLGAYNWSGDQCSCGRWITPTFMLHRNKVDEMKNVLRR